MDLHTQWGHRWVTPKAEARNSPIHGLGVFAVQQITKGEPVAVLGGCIVPKTEIENYWKVMGHVGIQIDENFFVVPTSRAELEHRGVFNHSCSPNIGFSSSISLEAMRDIDPNEELVFDYAFNETFHEGFNCGCGDGNCRKKITQDDWRLPGLQKFVGYYSPYLKARLIKA